MQQGDFNSPYYHYTPNNQPPPPPPPATYASAPPFAGAPASYAPPPSSTPASVSDTYSYPHNYPPFPPTSDPLPPPSPAVPDPHGIYSPPPPPHQQIHAPSYYPSYDSHQTAVNYTPPAPPISPTSYSNPYPNPNPDRIPSSYGYEKFDYGMSYLDDNSSSYGRYGSGKPNYGSDNSSSYADYGSGNSNYGSGKSNYGSELYGKRPESDRYDSGFYKDDGVYAYEGKSEPYGARGTASKSSTWSGMFDDYGRAISLPSLQEKKSSSSSLSTSSSLKVVRAVPKAEEKSDVKSGIQKFRAKLLPESGGQSVMDVLCMVGLDGIRMLDPNTNRTLRIYPLETVTRCDKIDSSTFAFWSKTSVDIEPRRIRLQSNSYTTNTILDTVTAATVQFKEMGGRTRPSESFKVPEQPAEKKKGFADWITKLKPVNEEKDHWVPDEAVTKCTGCGSDFSAFNRRHHCRNCGDVFCDKCTQGRTPLTADDDAPPVRVCDRCMAEVSHRLSKAKEAATRPVTLQSHEDLAKKLQEEMEKNLRISSGSKSEVSGRRMREVACPTCTVHLQVQVPSSGSETIECGVCQHPFLVSAH